jgi:uncharacterized protein
MRAPPSWTKTAFVLLIGLVVLSAIPARASAIPDYTGYMVNDWAYLLTYNEQDELEGLCRWIEEQTTVEIFVITTDDLEGEDLNRYSYLVFNEWGIGKEDVNNGILITLYYWENTTHYSYEFRIEIGRGMEGAITDAEAGRIGRDNMTFWFDYAYFYYGLSDGIEELYNEFKDDPSVVSPSAAPVGIAAFRAWGYENPLMAGILVGVGLMIFSFWVRMSLYRYRMSLIPLIGIGALLLFAWWWDPSLVVLGYAIVIAIGGTVTISGGSRVRSGGGRTDGGGWSN